MSPLNSPDNATQDVLAIDDDFRLVQRIQQRDAIALEQLYDRYSTRVYSVAWFVTRDVRLAEEATQNTFMKVWERAEQYQDQSSHFLAWLLTVTRRCAIDLLRHERRKAGWHELWDDALLAEIPDATEDTEGRWREMQLMLGQLPPEQRQVIVLSFYRGLSQSEMAEHLGVPLGTIKARARLGMQKLRTIFGNLK